MSWPVCYTHRTDARTLYRSLCLCLCRSFVNSCFPNSTFLTCLSEPRRRQPCAGLPSPRRAGRRIRVGLPTPDKSQKMGRETLPWCSLPSTNSSHPRAASHCLNNRMIRLACRLSQLHLYWTKHKVLRSRTSLLGTTKHHSRWECTSSTGLPGTI